MTEPWFYDAASRTIRDESGLQVACDVSESDAQRILVAVPLLPQGVSLARGVRRLLRSTVPASPLVDALRIALGSWDTADQRD
jgi:hypothetical protein